MRLSRTFEVLVNDYIERRAKPFKRTWRDDEATLKRYFLPEWKHRRLNELSRRDIRDVLDLLVSRGKGTTANRVLSLIRSVFAFAVDEDYCEANPAIGIRKPAPEVRRERLLSDDEIRAIWTALDTVSQLTADVLRFQFLTAQRIGEVMSLTWADLDLASGWWTIPAEKTKSNRAHRVPLSHLALAIVTARRAESTSPWVFPAPRSENRAVSLPTIHKGLMSVRRTTAIEFRSHDLRRTATTLMAACEVPPYILTRVLNHADQGVTSRHYNRHSYDAQKRTALETLARQLHHIISGETHGQLLPFVVNS
jgi:integrase